MTHLPLKYAHNLTHHNLSLTHTRSYLRDAFGNQTRIDYGTGHETCFVVWLFCLSKLELIKQGDMAAVVLRVFTRYLTLMRKLQTVYMLEPAGSHGVWSLDDYQMLPFYWGASQLEMHGLVVRPLSLSLSVSVFFDYEVRSLLDSTYIHNQISVDFTRCARECPGSIVQPRATLFRTPFLSST